MKKAIILSLFLVVSVAGWSQRYDTTDHFEVDDFSIKPGATATIGLKLVNPAQEYYGITCMMNLPEGVTLTGIAPDGNRMTAESHYFDDNFNTKHKVSGLCVICIPSKGTLIKGNSGNIMELTFQCDANAAEGTHVVSFAGSGLTTDNYYEYLTPANEFLITISNTATGIDEIGSDNMVEAQPRYNLSGQRVCQGYKGIVVEHGKKVIVK